MKNFCIILVALAHIAESTEPCESSEPIEPCRISGLPENTERHGDISILHVSRHDELQLSCRCTSYTPQWHVLTTPYSSDESRLVKNPVGCEDNGLPCEQRSQIFICPRDVKEGKFVYINYSPQLNQTVLLQCYHRFISGAQRDSVMLIVEDDPALQPSQTFTTSTTASVDSTPPPCDISTRPVPTVTLTVCPTTSSQADVIQPTKLPQANPSSSTPATSSSPTAAPTKDTGVADLLLEELGTPGLVLAPAVFVLVVVVFALVITIIALKYKLNKARSDQQTKEESLATNVSEKCIHGKSFGRCGSCDADIPYTFEYATSPVLPRRTHQTVLEINDSASVSNSLSSDSR